MAEEPPFTWIDPLFHYEPLPTDDSIRLLYLDSSENVNEPLRGELVPMSLSDLIEEEVDFAAISYFWGDVHQLRPIFIGSTIMGIGPNLYDALQWCRLADKPSILWADGVCINQKDVRAYIIV